MRTITGWRFLVYIAVPLVLASLGAINLSYDLLRKVEISSDVVEHQRNRAVLTEAINGAEADILRIVSENAKWRETALHTSSDINADWLTRTYGSSLSMGSTYDTVAVFDVANGSLLYGYSGGQRLSSAGDILGDTPFATYSDMLKLDTARRGAISGFLKTNRGPVVMAMAPIHGIDSNVAGNGRVLMLSKVLESTWLDSVQRQLLVGGLDVVPGNGGRDSSLSLKSPDGQPLMSLVWRDRELGNIVTAASWSKAGIVLGFLILVMAGIAFVCWTLVRQLVDDEGKAQHNALHDHLTGLPNRLALTNDMGKLELDDKPYALAFADLDGFKEVNDSYGHEFGDRLIYMIAKGIRELAPSAALCTRLGGDEFVVLFAGEDAGDCAKTFSARLIAMLKHPFDLEGRIASVGASIGIAERKGEEDVMEMLRRADIAMYKAKGSGKNRYCVFDESFDAERNDNLSIASELKSILASRNLDIVFQPVVNARSGEVTGVEALARWPSTSSRYVTADKFIGIAETSGLIDLLGELILERACVYAVAWPKIRLAVNISAVQLNHPGFVRRSLDVLHKHGVEPNRVEFEITETSLIQDTERAKQVFKELQQVGIKVALDDFGTGFSSIGYLRTFQFDRIKIDKSIVGKVLSSAAELAVVQGTLLVARGLSAEVTAEGVESAEQASVLRLAGCTELQGYHYHKPMTASAVTAMLRKSPIALVPRSVTVA
jgi:diguanylate cyclase (GGDEF)-like protein